MDIIENFVSSTKQIIDGLKVEMAGVRTGRASTAILENIKVNAYEQTLPLNQVGSTSVQLPRDILVTVWDESIVANVAKAIETSDLGLNPQVAGNVIRVHLPELTSETREILGKKIKQITEDCRIKIRQLREEANRGVQKMFDGSEISEDEKFKLREEIQKETERTNKEIEILLEKKITEINT